MPKKVNEISVENWEKGLDGMGFPTKEGVAVPKKDFEVTEAGEHFIIVAKTPEAVTEGFAIVPAENAEMRKEISTLKATIESFIKDVAAKLTTPAPEPVADTPAPVESVNAEAAPVEAPAPEPAPAPAPEPAPEATPEVPEPAPEPKPEDVLKAEFEEKIKTGDFAKDEVDEYFMARVLAKAYNDGTLK